VTEIALVMRLVLGITWKIGIVLATEEGLFVMGLNGEFWAKRLTQ